MTAKRKRGIAPDTEGVLAVGSLFLFGITLGAVMLLPIHDTNKDYVMLLLGALIGLVKDTFARYFNATKGAQEQRRATQDVISRLVRAAPPAPPVRIEDPEPAAAGKP